MDGHNQLVTSRRNAGRQGITGGEGACLFLVSAASLLFEITLTRIFSVSQFYHFAFYVVSIALLGYGASGTLMSLLPDKMLGVRSLRWITLATGGSILCAYLLVNELPFDSFRIAWDGRQVALLLLNTVALGTPFFFSGLAAGLLLRAYRRTAGKVYGINLFGAAGGAMIALQVPGILGGEGTVVLAALFASVGGFFLYPLVTRRRVSVSNALLLILIVITIGDIGSRLVGARGLPFLELHISPYKGLSYALQYPGAAISYRRWNATSRVDRVQSDGIRSLPGLSFRYMEAPPREDGLFIDGDDLSPVVRTTDDLTFTQYLPAALAYALRPEAQALVLEPRGGLDIVTALAGGAQQVTAVEANPSVVEAAGSIYSLPRITTVVSDIRSFLERTSARYDVIHLALTSTFHPVRSGAYSLAEDYSQTLETYAAMIARLQPDGLLVLIRWLQPEPSESLRTFALAVEALERHGLDPGERIMVLRSYNMIFFFLCRRPFNVQERAGIQVFAAERAYDLVYAPQLSIADVNRFNVLPQPVYYQAFNAYLQAPDRDDFYADYLFDIRPPTDNRPFFGHYFKWRQTGAVLAELGKTWQPFGGAGYFVILSLLALSLLLATGFILLPVWAVRLHWRAERRQDPGLNGKAGLQMMYFGLLGLAYLLVEIPLIQRFILFVGQPAYALTVVLTGLLLFSSLGSYLSQRLPLRWSFLCLLAYLVLLSSLLPPIFKLTLSYALGWRLVISLGLLAPLGFLMGVPFPAGLSALAGQSGGKDLIPWAWGINGAASVVAALLAALLALSFGFQLVLWVGWLCYAGAGIMALVKGSLFSQRLPR